MPANPPKKAINTYHIVSDVLASNSECASDNGLIKKYKVDAKKAITVANSKLITDLRINGKL